MPLSSTPRYLLTGGAADLRRLREFRPRGLCNAHSHTCSCIITAPKIDRKYNAFVRYCIVFCLLVACLLLVLIIVILLFSVTPFVYFLEVVVVHLGVMLGSFWGHVGVILESSWGHLGIILGSSWDHFGVILG